MPAVGGSEPAPSRVLTIGPQKAWLRGLDVRLARRIDAAEYGSADCGTGRGAAHFAQAATAQRGAVVSALISRTAAVLGLVFAAPLFGIVAVVNWVATGHVLFRQVRIGRGLKPFVMLKFQTMVEDASKGSTVTARHDPRITRIGRVLRLLKLDELPQLVNIAKGDMSFVGPRPLTPNEVEALPRAISEQVYAVAPGLTGISALVFANEERWLVGAADPERFYADEILPRKIALELAYARRRTWLGDLTIAVATPLAPFSAWVRRLVVARLVPGWKGVEASTCARWPTP